MKLPIKLRSSRIDDWAFVLSSWKKSNRKTSAEDNDVYYPQMHERIERCVAIGADVVIACDKDDEDFILGWSCTQPPNVIHYVYVRQSVRLMGVATELLSEIDWPVRCTHWTSAAVSYCDKHEGQAELDTELSGDLNAG